eukprot:gene21136-25391_t
MVADLAALVTAESPSSDLGAVDACADVVAEIGERHLGSTPERIRIDGRQHLRWSFGAEPKVMLLGHFDTVWPLGTLAELPWSVTDNIATGPGVFDMKAGIVQLFHALASLPSLDGVVVLLNSDEEIGSPTSRALIEEQARQVDAVLVLEAAADGAVKTARKGMSLYCVDIEGRAAHAGLEPERGVNAVVELAHQIQAVVELADPVAGTSVVPSVISGGTTTNTVAAQAQLWCDVRMWSAKEQERIDRSIRALTPALAESRISVSGGPNRGPLESVSSEKLYFLAHQVSSESGLGMLRDCAVGGASDGNFTAAVGTPTLDGLGAVGGGAHAATEHVEIDQMIPRATLLAGLTVQPFGGVSPSRMRQAISQAEQAALLACVTIETVTGHAELEQVFGLFEKVWQPESGNPPVHRDMMKALAHSGNYVAGAFRGGDLIGGSVAFFEEPQHRSLHSHITGILPNVQNGHIGLALKLFQRAWALERGILHVRWTFDPLVARNAYFNVSKLGALPIQYLPRFYAPMNDSLNGGADSDRLLIDWEIGSSKVSDVVAGSGEVPTPESLGASELLSVSEAGLPVLKSTKNRFVTVATPNDVYTLRKSDPAAANDWRLAVRETLGGVLAENGVVLAVTRTGKYVLDRAPGTQAGRTTAEVTS